MSIENEARPQDPGTNVLSLQDAAKPFLPALAEAQSRKNSGDDPAAMTAEQDQAESRAVFAPHRRRRLIGLGVFLVGAIVMIGYVYLDYTARFESTDDAFIEARQFIVAPKVAGYITEISVTDNQHVTIGDLIAQIDTRDYRIALNQAEAQVVAGAANIRKIDAQIEIQQAQVGASEAQVEQTQAGLTFAQQQAARYKDLAVREAGTVQMAQQTDSTLHQDQAALRNAQATLAAAKYQIESLKAQRSEAEAMLALANAQRDQAQLNLSYTRITAAQAGRVVNLTGSVGQFAQVGVSIAAFVPDELWIIANYKETQLAELRPGQPATIRIDAYPKRFVSGQVDSVQPGSGTAFSLLPAQNATGNYVKIVQRVPVKIGMSNPPDDVALGPGMSVAPVIRVQPALSLYERLLSWR